VPAAEPVEEFSPAEEADGEVVWLDQSAPPAPSPSLAPGKRPEDFAEEEIAASRPGGSTPARPAPQPVRKPRPKPNRDDSPVEVRVRLTERIARHRNALLLTAVPLVVLATVAVRLWRSRLADLPRVAELGRVEGLKALDEGDFARAHQILAEARRAVDRLGGAYDGAEAIRQGAAEAEVIARRAPDSLEEMLDQAGRSDPKEWAKTFATYYLGRTIIVIDAAVIDTPDSQGRGSYELDYRVVPSGEGGRPRTLGRLDFKGFRLFETTRPRRRQLMTFGASLASFRFDLDRGEWLVGLEPESGVLMTHAKALEALGGPPAGEEQGEAAP
jgi:hypothetical protein